jgi:hypothetical protein
MSPTGRDHRAGNIVWHLRQGVERFVRERAVNVHWAKAGHDLGARIAGDLGLPTPPR